MKDKIHSQSVWPIITRESENKLKGGFQINFRFLYYDWFRQENLGGTEASLMDDYQGIFARYEKKYLIHSNQHERLMKALKEKFRPDVYGLHTVCNIYYDTEDCQLIRTSLEKPVYKEKLRLRSYGTPGISDTVFLELKKKYKGVVYKRRVPFPLLEAQRYLNTGDLPEKPVQILREIDWFIHHYNTVPKAYIAYDREAWQGIDNPELRVTFDRDIRCRESMLDLTRGCWGTPLLPPDTVLMEWKLPGVMPLWLSRLLGRNNILPVSYSKYGTFYQNYLARIPYTKGELLNA
jgi:hypothetical protein